MEQRVVVGEVLVRRLFAVPQAPFTAHAVVVALVRVLFPVQVHKSSQALTTLFEYAVLTGLHIILHMILSLEDFFKRPEA